MRNKFIAYALIVVFVSGMASWSALTRRATAGQGSGNSWHSSGSGAGYGGGGWASGGGGGHK